MVEKPYARKGHSDVVLVASGHNMVVANRAASLRNKVYAAFVGTFDVVAESPLRNRFMRKYSVC